MKSVSRGMTASLLKKLVLSALLFLIMTCAAENVYAAAQISESKLILGAGEKYDLKVTGTKKMIRWSSSEPAVASVSKAGTVKGKSAGKAVVTAKVSGKTLKCRVTVRVTVKSDEGIKNSKGKWKKQNGKKYYLLEDGSMASGARLIGDTYYVFDENGALLRPEKDSLITVRKQTYYVSAKGKAISGWNIINGRLYRFTKRGRMLKDKVIEGVTLTKNGKAKKDQNTVWKIKFMKTAAAVTNDRMTKQEKLRACWNYVVSRSHFRYASKYPNLKEDGWQRKQAYNMLSTHSGNCYSFACAFAALAREVGYKPYVVCGRVSGSRDRARDGLTRHSWVIINGCNYDPEGQYAGWYRGCYGSGGYRIRHTVQKVIKFS